MGNKKRKNKRKNKKKPVKKNKKQIKESNNTDVLLMEDIFLFNDVYIKNNKIINMEIKDIYNKKISIKNLGSKKIFLDNESDESSKSNGNSENENKKICYKEKLLCNINKDNSNPDQKILSNTDIYNEIINELKKYKEESIEVNNNFMEIPLNEWGEWIYV